MNSIFILKLADWMVAGVIAVVMLCVVTRLVQQKRICITQVVATVLLATYFFGFFAPP